MFESYDWNNNGKYSFYRLTEKGENWMLNNQDIDDSLPHF
jgi:hypothetical protein